LRPDIFVMVDNCYGMFTTDNEPSHFGADVCVGSLIKNAGGGLAPTGAYLVGTNRAIERIEARLTAPGIGREVGSYAASYQPFYQGLFMAPHTVAQAVKTAVLAARTFELLGMKTTPSFDAPRADIIQAIQMETPERLIAFCQGIQAASPIDASAMPEPWAMPGYTDQVIMAAGTFVSGATTELSADAPIRAPYTAYLQGGLTYIHGKIALISALEKMVKENSL
ncbi:MAG: methionine gamma-lyase family protein, partial [Clostridia bacterium]|nr:methionine gamma-lyase family protein [Clostridia bacterium]